MKPPPPSLRSPPPERELLEVQADLERAQRIAQLGSWRLNLKDGMLRWSQEKYRMHGIPVDEPVTPERAFALVHPEDRPLVEQAWQAALRGAPFDLEYRIIVAGQEKWLHAQAEVVRDAGGELAEAFGTVQDVTARKYAETALQKSHARLVEQDNLLRAITENSPDAIFLLDRAHRLLYANPAALAAIRESEPDRPLERIHGQTAEAHFFDPAVARAMQAADESVMNSGHTEVQEIELRTPAGRRVLSISRTPYRDAAGQVVGLVGLAHDITQRKQDEAGRLREMERQRNALVREVHHRIKNHLQGVIGLLSERLRAAPQLACMLEQTIADLQVIAEVHGLQGARGDTQATLASLVEMAMHASLLDKPIQYEILPSARQWVVPERDVVPLALILNELLANAVKHCDATGASHPVWVAAEVGDTHACITVRNGPSRLPAGFSLDAGQGLGTGLALARALLPANRVSLDLRQEGEEVVAELRLGHAEGR